jgi:hypothetical protein
MVTANGTAYGCSYAASQAECGPYQQYLEGACSPPPPGCSLVDAPGVPGAAGVMGLVLLATAAATALRRFA